jgi:ElaB/YqjD/DUF883 family membrane-anchored ribosome-binding protein
MTQHATGHGQATLAPDIEQLREDVASLTREFSELLGHIKSGAAHRVDEAEQAVLESVDHAAEKTKHAYDALAAAGARSVKTLGRQVEEQPVISLLIAFGVGVIASRLLSR